jgi:hypothetical protein
MDATSKDDIAAHEAADDEEAMQGAAKFTRRARQRLGLNQNEFSRRIDFSRDTLRNWEQGKRCPAGAATSRQDGVPTRNLDGAARSEDGVARNRKGASQCRDGPTRHSNAADRAQDAAPRI